MVSGFRRRLSFRVLSVVVAFVLILPQGALAAQPACVGRHARRSCAAGCSGGGDSACCPLRG